MIGRVIRSGLLIALAGFVPWPLQGEIQCQPCGTYASSTSSQNQDCEFGGGGPCSWTEADMQIWCISGGSEDFQCCKDDSAGWQTAIAVTHYGECNGQTCVETSSSTNYSYEYYGDASTEQWGCISS